MQLKDRLRELRGKTTQRECAAKLGVKFTNYNKWEQGAIPSLETLVHIANYYSVTLDYLAGRTDFKNPDYQQTTIETGLTENALKGLAKIKESSEEENNVNILDALNFLLEKELEPDVQENLAELQDRGKMYYLFQLFPAAYVYDYPSSLSAILYYIAKDDNAVDDDYYALTYRLRELIRDMPETTDKEKSQKAYAQLQTYNIYNIFREYTKSAQFSIPNVLLPVLNAEYGQLGRQHPKGCYENLQYIFKPSSDSKKDEE